MNMTYFTSDQHFGHYNIIRLCGRPFKAQEEMDEILLSKWNAKVKDNDTVFILGDLFFSPTFHVRMKNPRISWGFA